jgi:hypothetical protein
MTDYNPKEYKVVALRDCPVPDGMKICEQPQQVADYWRMHIATHPYFNPDCECFVVLLLNTRRRVKGHHLVSIGTMDTILVHPREVFSVAVAMKAAFIVLIHNLCAATHKLCYVKCRLMCSDRLTALMLIWSRAQARGMAVLSRTDVVFGSMWISPRGGCHA